MKLLTPPPKLLVGCMRLIAESESVSLKCGLIFFISWVSSEFRSSRVMFAVSDDQLMVGLRYVLLMMDASLGPPLGIQVVAILALAFCARSSPVREVLPLIVE